MDISVIGSVISNILYFLVPIIFFIIIHELGHYVGAKAVGVEVEEFGLGFPPHAKTLFEAGGTKFTLNWIPLGGFVRPKGENDPNIMGGLAASAPWKRLIVFFAGPIMNLLAAAILYSYIGFNFGLPLSHIVSIGSVSPNSPALTAGIQVGDEIVAINSSNIDGIDALRTIVYDNLGEEIEIILNRQGELQTINLVPRDPAPEDGAIGIGLTNPVIAVDSSNVIYAGAQYTGIQVQQVFRYFGRMFGSGEFFSGEGRVVGYTSMYRIFDYSRQLDEQIATDAPAEAPAGQVTLNFFAWITLSLGLFNLFPLPALDGGRIVFTLYELLFRRRVPEKIENTAHVAFFMLLIAFMIYVNVMDIANPIALPELP